MSIHYSAQMLLLMQVNGVQWACLIRRHSYNFIILVSVGQLIAYHVRDSSRDLGLLTADYGTTVFSSAS